MKWQIEKWNNYENSIYNEEEAIAKINTVSVAKS